MSVILALMPARYEAKGPALPGRIDGWSLPIPQQRLLKTGRRLRGSLAFGVVSAHFQSQPQSIPESVLSVKEVAARVGFDHEGRFIGHFRGAYGVTPCERRRTVLRSELTTDHGPLMTAFR